jgi:cytochrome c oxidase subunit I
MFINRW